MKFLTPLRIQVLRSPYMRVLCPFCVEDDDGTRYTVPGGFVSDGASVPRIPIIYWLFGGDADAAAVLHDMLYRWKLVSRKKADQLFLRAMAHDVSWLRRDIMYSGVRLFGRRHYGRRPGGCLDPRVVCLFQCQNCPHYFPGWRRLNERTS